MSEVHLDEMSDSDTIAEIVDQLQSAIGHLEEAYDAAKLAWGENEPRTQSVNSAWAEVDNCRNELRDTQ